MPCQTSSALLLAILLKIFSLLTLLLLYCEFLLFFFFCFSSSYVVPRQTSSARLLAIPLKIFALLTLLLLCCEFLFFFLFFFCFSGSYVVPCLQIALCMLSEFCRKYYVTVFRDDNTQLWQKLKLKVLSGRQCKRSFKICMGFHAGYYFFIWFFYCEIQSLCSTQ